MPYISLKPTQAILDQENPRLPDGTTSDREAINRLLDDGAEALIGLARDMAQTGQTNPAELPIAVREGSKYLILEGNRRFAALKLLKDPNLAESESHRQSFRRAANLGSPPASIFTLVVNTREEAEHWIVLRHTGENGGRGVKRWSATQVAAHRRRANRPVDSGTVRSILIADELEEVYADDNEIVEYIRRIRREKPTNIGRFFSVDMLDRLDLVIRPDDSNPVRTQSIWSHYSAAVLRNFFAWALSYVADNAVYFYRNADVRREAINEHAKHLLPVSADRTPDLLRLVDGVSNSEATPSDSSGGDDETGGVAEGDGGGTDHAYPGTSGATAASSSSASSGAGGAAGATAQSGSATNGGGAVVQGRARTREPRPERYLFQDLKLPNHPVRVQNMLRECREIEMERLPSVACVMSRVLMELSVSCASVLALSGATEGQPLKEKALAALRFLDPDVEHPRKGDKDLQHAFLVVSSTDGIMYLNAFVHNPSLVPDAGLARRFSGAFRPFLARLDAKI